MNSTFSNHPKAYTVEEIDGVWHFYYKNGTSRPAGEKHGTYSGSGGYWINNTKEWAETLAAQEKEWDDFNSWQEICGNLSDENFVKGARKYDKLIRRTVHLQNWLRDELLMRLILKNS